MSPRTDNQSLPRPLLDERRADRATSSHTMNGMQGMLSPDHHQYTNDVSEDSLEMTLGLGGDRDRQQGDDDHDDASLVQPTGGNGDDSYDDGEYINHDVGLEDSVEIGQQEEVGAEESGKSAEGEGAQEGSGSNGSNGNDPLRSDGSLPVQSANLDPQTFGIGRKRADPNGGSEGGVANSTAGQPDGKAGEEEDDAMLGLGPPIEMTHKDVSGRQDLPTITATAATATGSTSPYSSLPLPLLPLSAASPSVLINNGHPRTSPRLGLGVVGSINGRASVSPVGTVFPAGIPGGTPSATSPKTTSGGGGSSFSGRPTMTLQMPVKQEGWSNALHPNQPPAIPHQPPPPPPPAPPTPIREKKPSAGLGIGQLAQPQPTTISGQAMVAATTGGVVGGGGKGRGSSAEAGPSRSEAKRKASARKRAREAKVETDNEDFLAAVDENDMPIPGTIFKNAFGPDDVDEMDDDDDDDDSPNERRNKKGKSLDDKSSGFVVDGDGDQARRKIRIEYIEDRSRRHITFSKRKAGIMKKAYELSTLTGTQLLLLVVSETGLVYTFSTDKLSAMVQKSEGVKMIQACLNTPDNNAEDEEEPEEPKPKRRGKDKLAIRPLKLNDSAKANLAASTSKAAAQNTDGGAASPSPPPQPVEEIPVAPPPAPVPSLPSTAAARPKKRLPSGKSKKALAAAKKASEAEEITNLPALSDMPPFQNGMQQQQSGDHLQQPHSATSSHHDIGPHPGMIGSMPMMSPLQGNFSNHIPQHLAPEYHQHQPPQQTHSYYGGGHHAGQHSISMPSYGYPPHFPMPNTMPPNAMSQNTHYGQHPMQGLHHYEPMQDHSAFGHHQGPDPHMTAQMGMTGQ